ncbi:MAG TPA: hypothetical protein VF893_04450 [Candidatus Bathyarchaeia archaeon]
MKPKKMLQIVAIIVFLFASVTIVYYLIKANLFSHATGVFWDGAITGFGGCLFLLSLILTISLRTSKSMLTKKRGDVYSMLALSGLVTAILWFFKPGDSDVWWYGAIAGFFSCAVLVLLTVTAFIAYRLMY